MTFIACFEIKLVSLFRLYRRIRKNILSKKFVLCLIGGFLMSASFATEQCVSGNCHKGYGSFSWASGSFYRGDWVNGLQDGFGNYEYDNGDAYSGDFKKGKKEGKGTYIWKNGDKYVGEFDNDVINGHGRYTFKKDDAFSDGRMNNVEIPTSANSAGKE